MRGGYVEGFGRLGEEGKVGSKLKRIVLCCLDWSRERRWAAKRKI